MYTKRWHELNDKISKLMKNKYAEDYTSEDLDKLNALLQEQMNERFKNISNDDLNKYIEHCCELGIQPFPKMKIYNDKNGK